MDLGLNGRIALVAASSKGLGRAIAHLLAQQGARVCMCARNRDELEQAADAICQDTGCDVFTFVADLSTADGPKQFVEASAAAMGGVDILVTNAGGPPMGTFMELSEQAWSSAWNLLLMSSMRLIRAATPHMQTRGGGRIVNVTSISVKEPIAGLMLSNAYRTAVVAMAKTLAAEMGPHNILINNVCPGRIATDRITSLDQQRAEKAGISIEQVRHDGQKRIPLGRYGQPEELAALVAFLVSRQASYITGTTILCDGGASTSLM